MKRGWAPRDSHANVELWPFERGDEQEIAWCLRCWATPLATPLSVSVEMGSYQLLRELDRFDEDRR